MEPHPALIQYDILLEIIRHFAVVQRPYDLNHRRSNAYWGPPHPLIEDNVFNYEKSAIDSADQQRRKTLARLSLTCKAFSEPALSELWSAPCGGLYTMLRLFPTFKYKESRDVRWRIERRMYNLHEYYFNGDPSNDDWNAFRRCAGRVRELAYHTYWDVRTPYNIQSAVFATLFEHNSGQPLFPNLQVLSWQRSSPDDSFLAKLARMLAPPTLSVLRLCHPMWRDSEPEFRPAYFSMDGRPEDLQIFTDACPSLRHILIELLFQSHDLYPLAGCRDLWSLSVRQVVDFEFLRRLAQLSRLTDLNVVLRGEASSDTDTATSALTGTLFPALRNISFTDSSPSLVTSFLSHVLLPALTSAGMRLMDARSNDILVCLRALCSPNIGNTLRVLRITFECTDAESSGESETCQFNAVARPLLCLSAIEILSFSVYGRALGLSDADVAEMACSWPRMVSLSIKHAAKWRPNDNPRPAFHSHLIRPSLSALVSLAERCCTLESMKFDPADVSEAVYESLEARPSSTVPRPALSQLVLARSDAFDDLVIDDVIRLASILHRLFPDLEGRGVLAEHERRPIRDKLSVRDAGRDNHAHELLRRLDALQAERKRAVRRPVA